VDVAVANGLPSQIASFSIRRRAALWSTGTSPPRASESGSRATTSPLQRYARSST